MPKVNPEILIWARKTAGLTLEEAVQKLGIRQAYGISASDRLLNMENGKEEPSRTILKNMSKKYRRSLLVFYLISPPEESKKVRDFRKLPESFTNFDKALTDTLIRKIQIKHSIVHYALLEEDEERTIPFIGSETINGGVKQLANKIITSLELDISTFRKKRTKHDSREYLREKVESTGVFVLYVDNLGNYLSEIPVEAFRGFALADNLAPFIAVNCNDSIGAQSFTILHELTHLWLGYTCVGDNSYSEQEVERFCNQVASEILLPEGISDLGVAENTSLEEALSEIKNFADSRNISRSMIAYRLRRASNISNQNYQTITNKFKEEYQIYKQNVRDNRRESSSGVNYFTIRRNRAGKALVNFVDRMLLGGVITTTKAGLILGVSGKNVGNVLWGNVNSHEKA